MIFLLRFDEDDADNELSFFCVSWLKEGATISAHLQHNRRKISARMKIRCTWYRTIVTILE